MSDVSPQPQPPEVVPPAKPRWRRVLRFVVTRVVFWYAVICVLMTVFQRQILYQPSRAESISPDEAGLPNGLVHDLLVPTADGLTLHAWHFSQQVCDTREQCDRDLQSGAPLMLFFHGNGADRRNRVLDSLVFTGAGANVFVLDYRGYGENPGSPSETGLTADARALWKYATETRGVPPSRIVLFGESLGGGVAVRLAADLCREGTPPAGLILRSSFLSLADVASRHYPWLPVRWLLWDRYASDERIGDVTCPILMIHGTQDRVVPFASGKALFDVAPTTAANGQAKQFVALIGADHNDVLFAARNEFAAAVEKFLR